MKKSVKLINVRPSKDACEKCRNHGICLAETGRAGYICNKKTGTEPDF